MPRKSSIGPDSTILSLNLPKAAKKQLQSLADKSGVKLSVYCRAILDEAIKDEAELKYQAEVKRKSETDD